MSAFDPETLTWKGPRKLSIYSQTMPFGRILMECLEKAPEKVIQINACSGISLTCDEVRRKSIRVAFALSKMGFLRGDLAMIACKNQPETAPVFFGCFLIGVPINPIDVSFSQDDVAHMVGLLRPKLIFCNFDQFEKIEAACEQVEHYAHFITFNGFNHKSLDIEQLFQAQCDEDLYEPPDLGDISQLPLVILCSSGTTGLPKGVCLSHPQVTHQVERFVRIYENDVILSFSSPYWISGFLNLVLAPLKCCTRVVTTEPYSSKLVLSLIEKYRVTHMLGAPIQFQLMLKDPDIHMTDFSSMRLLALGGAIVTKGLRLGLQKLIPRAQVVVAYGMTEFVGLCAKTETDGANDEDGSVGVLIPDTEGCVVDENGERLGPGEKGVIYLRNPIPFLGYWNNEEATSDTLTADLWIKTGDIGYFNDEGVLHVTGRDKDMLKYMGYQISPMELEAIIEKLDGVQACCVVGISDSLYGDLPAAAIVKSSESTLTEEDVEAAVEARVSEYKRLRGGVYFLEFLPRTASGKIRAKVVRKMLTRLYKERFLEGESEPDGSE